MVLGLDDSFHDDVGVQNQQFHLEVVGLLDVVRDEIVACFEQPNVSLHHIEVKLPVYSCLAPAPDLQ
jgi:hypothetical protein